MKRLSLTYDQFEQQYRRALFNVVGRNHDDHVKNFSFLMNEKGKWRISPAYDITYSYRPNGSWTDVHQSSLDRKYDNFERDELINFGKYFGIKKTNRILEEVITAVIDWPVIAREIGLPKNKINAIRKNHRLDF